MENQVTKIYAPLESGCKNGYVTTPEQIKNLDEYIRKVTLDDVMNIDYEELRSLCIHGKLIPGQRFCIMDYVTIAIGRKIESCEYPFALIVTAESSSELKPEAKAVMIPGDSYFSSAGAKLDMWELRYDINNDDSKYGWIDPARGKGVIYYMKDEWGNEAPFDFKNIMFDGLCLFYNSLSEDGSLKGDCCNNKVYPYCINNRQHIQTNNIFGSNNLVGAQCGGIQIKGNNNKILSSYGIQFHGDDNVFSDCEQVKLSNILATSNPGLFRSIFTNFKNIEISYDSSIYNTYGTGEWNTKVSLMLPKSSPTILTYIRKKENEEVEVTTDAIVSINEVYAINEGVKVVLNDEVAGEHMLKANERMRFIIPIEGDLIFTLEDEPTMLEGYGWQPFGDDWVKPFEVEFAISPNLTTAPRVTFTSKNYDRAIYWETPFEPHIGSFYRVTIDFNIARFVEIGRYRIVRPR